MKTGRRGSILVAAGMLSGGIIGAGIFSLPYVVDRTGLLMGALLLVLGTSVYCYVHLLYADILEGTKEEHRFVGLVSGLLGREYTIPAIIVAVIEMILVLLIYIVLATHFLGILFPDAHEWSRVVIAWAIGSVTIFLPLRKLSLAELLATGGIIAIIVLLFSAGLPQMGTFQTKTLVNTSNPLMPLAALLFALSGRYALPPVLRYLRATHAAQTEAVRSVIVLGTVIPGGAYALFISGVLALSPVVSADALSGLQGGAPAALVGVLSVLGILALWSSYVLVGLDVHDTLRYDLKLPAWLRIGVVVGMPLVLYGLGFTDFITLIGIAGGVFLALEGCAIVRMWQIAKKRGMVAGYVKRVPHGVVPGLYLIFILACIGAIITESM